MLFIGQADLENRVNLGVPKLDQLLGGGLSRGHTILLSGDPGCGKTSLILQYLSSGVTSCGEFGVLVSFLDGKDVVLEGAKRFGWQLKRFEREGSIRILSIPDRLEGDESRVKGDDLLEEIIRMIDEVEAERLAVDGLEEFAKTLEEEEDFRVGLSRLRKKFRDRGCTSIMTSSPELNVGELVDGVISLHSESTGLEKVRTLEVVKMSGTGHTDRLIPFEIKDSGIVIRELPEERLSMGMKSKGEMPTSLGEGQVLEGVGYQKLLNDLNDGVVVLDLEGNIGDMNDTVIEKLRYSREELLGKNVRDLIPSEDVDKVDRVIGQVKQGEEVVFESAVLDESGERIPVEVGSKLITYRGNPAVLSVARDISKRKDAGEKEELLHSLLRHDLRNKSQVIQGYVELLKDTKLSDEQYQYLGKMDGAAKDCIDLIDKVRSLRKVGEIEIEKVNINSILSTVLSENEPRASGKGMKLKFERCECKVMGGYLLEEVFSNLVENSIRHSEGKTVKISGHEKEHEAIITVEDDGKGIPDDDKEKIFERGFKRGGNAGSGLGMYLVKEIVESYGGSIEVKDSELGGARFDVHLKKA